MARRNVLAMAPPMISRSTRGSRFSMTSIFPEIFAPPRIATNGRSGASRALPRNRSSASIRSPATAGFPSRFICSGAPTVDAWARCAAPNASFT
jgi:hypothetical protein